jgi:hypothetical protein
MKMTNKLFECAKSVNSRAEFVRFVNDLNIEYKTNRNEWENDNLENFLCGLSGFSNDMAGFYKNMGESVDVEVITWRMVAQMLLAAKVYGN